jgi:hemolysin III
MGWLIVILIWPLSKQMEPNGLIWMGIGGAFYTIGAVIYAFKKPNPWPKILGFHEIFHIFVLFGSFSHYLVVYSYS